MRSDIVVGGLLVVLGWVTTVSAANNQVTLASTPIQNDTSSVDLDESKLPLPSHPRPC
jgi:hypothetical protein